MLGAPKYTVNSGPSAWLVGRRCSTGCFGSINGQFAPAVRTVRKPRGSSAVVPRTVRPCRARVGPRPRSEIDPAPPSLPPPNPILSFSLLLAPSLRKGLLPRDFDWGTPRTVRAHPRTLREVLHHVIRVFFSNPSFYFSDFEQEGD
jgi:hypothetical protein